MLIVAEQRSNCSASALNSTPEGLPPAEQRDERGCFSDQLGTECADLVTRVAQISRSTRNVDYAKRGTSALFSACAQCRRNDIKLIEEARAAEQQGLRKNERT